MKRTRTSSPRRRLATLTARQLRRADGGGDDQNGDDPLTRLSLAFLGQGTIEGNDSWL